MTKGDTDPLLSAEENCSDLIDMPTRAELDNAITGNMSQLLVVVSFGAKVTSGPADVMVDESSQTFQEATFPQTSRIDGRHLWQVFTHQHAS